MKREQQRQGDLLFVPISKLPNILFKERKNGILAYGESSGHYHLARGCQVLEPEAPPENPEGEIVYLVIQESATITHEGTFTGDAPHKTVELPGGVYQVVTPRQYDPYEQASRQVAD